MTKPSLKKLSLLGLVLVGASAVAAAVIPANKDDEKLSVNGTLTVSSDGNQTCTTWEEGDASPNCSADTATQTSVIPDGGTSGNGTETEGGGAQTSA